MDPEFKMTDRQTLLGYAIGWRNRNQLTFRISEQFVKLNRSFDPTNTGGIELVSGSEYNWISANISFLSDTRRALYYQVGSGYGSYYNGNKLTIVSSVHYRFQPYGSIAITASYNNISLPNPYSSAKLILVGPRLDLTLTDKLFITAFAQYNNQIDNFNLNLRFQWRFAPVSDLFIIYTGNSYTGDFINKNRGLAIKISYWIN